MAAAEPVTLERIARESGLSLSAVSKILRRGYKANTPKGRKRVAEVTALAQRLGYIANGSARRLRSGRHHAVAVLASVDNLGYPEGITFEYINGVAAALATRGYALTLLNYPREEPLTARTRLADRSVDAAIVLDQTTPELERFLAEAVFPTVFVNTEPRAGMATVTRDEYAVTRALIDVIVGLGYRRIIVAGSWDAKGHYSFLRRAEAIVDGTRSTGIELVYARTITWYPNFESVLAAAKPDPETLVLAMDANTALRSMRCLAPDQPLACCDDARIFAAVAPWLTRATFDRAALGHAAAHMLLAHLDDPASPLAPIEIQARVLIGQSTPRRG